MEITPTIHRINFFSGKDSIVRRGESYFDYLLITPVTQLYYYMGRNMSLAFYSRMAYSSVSVSDCSHPDFIFNRSISSWTTSLGNSAILQKMRLTTTGLKSCG